MHVKVVFVAFLLSVGCAAVALAHPGPSSSSDQAFVRSLENPQEIAPPDVGTPNPQWKTCSASIDCGDGNTAACTGNSNCHTTIAGVMCDGTEVKCPNFCSISQSCDCCNGPYIGTCWSRHGDCQYTDDGIECNGHEFTCGQLCPLCPQ